MSDLERHDELEAYVKGVVGRFRSDRRVVVWDLFNEPDNPNIVSYRDVELSPEVKVPAAEALLRKAFEWARSMGPMQPITAGVWAGTTVLRQSRSASIFKILRLIPKS